jgi:hypothetical protein
MDAATLLKNPDIRSVYERLKESDGIEIANRYIKVELAAQERINQRLSKIETERLKYYLKDEDKRHKSTLKRTKAYKEAYGTVRALLVR